MKRIFEQRQIKADGKILPLEEFVLFRDVKGAPDAQKAEIFAKKATIAKDKPIAFFAATDYMDFERTGSREKQYLQNDRRIMLNDLLAAKLCGKEADLDKIIDLVWAIMEESNWVWPAHNRRNNYDGGRQSPLPIAFGKENIHHIDLLSGFTGASLAFALYLCEKEFDGVAPIISQKLRYTLDERILTPFMEQDFWWMGLKKRPNNWNPWCISNILTVCALVEKDTARRTAIVNRALYLLDFYTDSLPDDGGCDEGPMYFTRAGAAYFDALEVLWDLSGGQIDVYDHPFIRKIAEYAMAVHISGTYFANFADACLRANMDGCQFERFAKRVGCDELASFAAYLQTQQSLDSFDLSAPYRYFKDLYTTNAPAGTLCAAKMDSFLPDLQVMTKRELPAFDRGLCLVAKGGHNAESHNHCDVGSFIVYADGEPMLVDVGRDNYTKKTFSDDRYDIWFMNSAHHNLPTIGGLRQPPEGAYKAELLSYSPEQGMVLELKDAWPKEAGILSYKRTYSLVDGAVKIKEDMAFSSKTPVDFHFMTGRDVKVEKGKIFFDGGRVMTFAGDFDIKVEAFPLGSGYLFKDWKRAELYRITVSVPAFERGTLEWQIR